MSENEDYTYKWVFKTQSRKNWLNWLNKRYRDRNLKTHSYLDSAIFSTFLTGNNIKMLYKDGDQVSMYEQCWLFDFFPFKILYRLWIYFTGFTYGCTADFTKEGFLICWYGKGRFKWNNTSKPKKSDSNGILGQLH